LVGSSEFFFSNINFIHQQYKEFFGIDEQTQQIDDDGVEDSTEIPKKEATIRFYFALTYQLAKEDILKIEQMDSVPTYLCLNVAALMKERHDKEQEEIKKIERQMKK
jgi:lipoprotein NlpI